ncbi:hypothetical protein [Leptospira weilii]|uniref:hypothetical protein n=1 Tax=Leptospira weilii TaxID=28184 RepID=UPI001E50AAC0|nr:hypothetical protein [Leptospira weilii]
MPQPGERRLSNPKLTLDEYKNKLKEAILSYRINPNHEDFREYDEGKTTSSRKLSTRSNALPRKMSTEINF